jgi:hypothetical protein
VKTDPFAFATEGAPHHDPDPGLMERVYARCIIQLFSERVFGPRRRELFEVNLERVSILI